VFWLSRVIRTDEERQVSLIQPIHKKGLVYPDIKPSNVLLGKPGGEDESSLHIADLKTMTKYANNQPKARIPSEDHKYDCTPLFSSANRDLGGTASRRDDLEAICHMLVYLLGGNLPWSALKGPRLREVGELKQFTTVADLCKGLPPHMATIMTYVRGLGLAEPDYEHLKALFQGVGGKSGRHSGRASFKEGLGRTLEAVPAAPKLSDAAVDAASTSLSRGIYYDFRLQEYLMTVSDGLRKIFWKELRARRAQTMLTTVHGMGPAQKPPDLVDEIISFGEHLGQRAFAIAKGTGDIDLITPTLEQLLSKAVAGSGGRTGADVAE
jgi:serine/threonine protein kinase